MTKAIKRQFKTFMGSAAVVGNPAVVQHIQLHVKSVMKQYDSGEQQSQPEKLLCAAVLERAIRDLMDFSTKKPEVAIRLAAYDWFCFEGLEDDYRQLKKQDEFKPYSFLWICDELKLQPKIIADIIYKQYHMPYRIR